MTADHGTSDVPGTGVPGTGTDAARQTFRSPIAVLIFWVWLAFAVANLADLAVQGHDHVSAMAGAVLILVTGVAYVAGLRPKVIADDEGIAVRNPLREHRVPWASVAGIDLGDVLRVRCEWRDPAAPAAEPSAGQAEGEGAAQGEGMRRKVISAWAIQASRRRRMSSELRGVRPGFGSAGMLGAGGRRGLGGPGDGRLPGGYGRPSQPSSEPIATIHRKETERIAGVLRQRAEQAHARPAGAVTRSGPASPVSAWHWPSVAILLVPVLLLIVAIVT